MVDQDDTIHITVCGDGGCGKSSITLRLVRSQWNNDYDPTIEDSYSVTRILDGHPYHLQLTDTAGQEEYRSLFGASNLQNADAFLLVYDITSLASLHALQHHTQLIAIEEDQRLERGGIAPVKMVAGNKCDLKERREVRAPTGMEWARKNQCMFMETSAREKVNVEETFALIIKKVVEARRQQTQGTKPHAASRTQPLTPLEEKADPGISMASAPHRDDEEGGFWSKLRCW